MRTLQTAMDSWSETFFFSSRRRHTRSDRDWSSDVCSSDLPPYRTATRHAIAPTQMRRSRAAIDVDPAGGSRAIATREAPASESERVDERLKRREIGRASCRERV